MPRERLIRVGILAILGLALMGFFRPDSPDPTEDVKSAQTSFFINKAHNRNRYDMVIVGDSRALRGLAPELIEEQIPGNSIFNLAFHAGGMNQQIYHVAENLLRADSPQKSILLAPTSLAFLPHKKANSQFNEYLGKPRDQVWFYQNHPEWAEFFQPVSPSVYLRRLLDLEPHELLFQEFKPGGWIATNQTPHDDVANFSEQREILADYQIEPTLIDDLMAQTREWTNEGIEVFCLFPPAYRPRETFEDSVLGFDRDGFRRSFEAAGGTWLDVDGSQYTTYDGSHLVKDSSLELSRAAGRAIAKAREN